MPYPPPTAKKTLQRRRAETPVPPRPDAPQPVAPALPPVPAVSPSGHRYAITTERRNVLLDKIRLGHSYEDACRLAGIATSTFELWMQKGEASTEDAPREPYHSFFFQVRQAESEAVDAAMQSLKDHFGKDWRAAEAFLKRKRRAEWGEQKQEAPQQGGSTVIFVMPSNGRDAGQDPAPPAIDTTAREVDP